MEWYYVKDNQQAGPVNEEELRGLLESGQITTQTLVWKAGMANWLPLQQTGVAWLPAAAVSGAITPAGAPPLAEPATYPPGPPSRPPVLTWYRVYCAAMAVLYVLVAFLGLAMLTMSDQLELPTKSPREMQMIGAVYTAMGFGLFIPFAAALALPYRKWTWIYGIVLIGLGMTSCICLPVTIPLLIYWLKPETKAFFTYFPVDSQAGERR